MTALDQVRIKAVLNWNDGHCRGQSIQHRLVIIAFRTKKDNALLRRLPLRKMDELCRKQGMPIKTDAMSAPPAHLGWVGLDKDHIDTARAQSVAQSTSDTARSHHEDCVR